MEEVAKSEELAMARGAVVGRYGGGDSNQVARSLVHLHLVGSPTRQVWGPSL